jgi:tripartite-type tricarboxylate transporter receptor subunit TctC
MPEFTVEGWLGAVLPVGTPPDIVERLNREINAVLAKPDVLASLDKQGFEIPPPSTPAAFAKTIADDMAKWVPLIKASGARVN